MCIIWLRAHFMSTASLLEGSFKIDAAVLGGEGMRLGLTAQPRANASRMGP